MTIRFAKTGEAAVLDYRETAPCSSKKDMYASEESKKLKFSQERSLAAAVPGEPLGLWKALEKYGAMNGGAEG